LGEEHPELNGSTITTVRLADKGEISLMRWHADKLASERP
jgi:hypothetical protein